MWSYAFEVASLYAFDVASLYALSNPEINLIKICFLNPKLTLKKEKVTLQNIKDLAVWTFT